MAWSAPAAFSVSEVVTAAKMQILADDLIYLKGTSAPVQIDNDLTAVLAAGATLTAQGTNNGSFGRFKMLAKTAGAATVDWRFLANGNGGAEFSIYDAVAAQTRMLIDSAGLVGFGTATPAGKLHAVGAGGGWLFLSANAVTTLQTIAPAGTVTVGMIVWLCDRNNGAGAFASGFNGQVFALTSALTYVNTDTMTLTLTAGGAITIARTTGTNGSHQVNLAVMYF